MASLSLARALRLKNELAGEVRSLQELIQAHNTWESRQAQNYDVNKLYAEYEAKSAKLVLVKAELAKANMGIYEKIAMMAELKGQIVFLRALSCREDEQVQGYGDNKTVFKWTCAIKDKDITERVRILEVRISKFQDEVDVYNHTVNIEI